MCREKLSDRPCGRTLLETAQYLQDGGHLGHVSLAAAAIFPSVDVDERVRPVHCAREVATLVLRVGDVGAVQDLPVVETGVREDADGRVHPVLHVQKVLLVSE